jgi:hypothetical protein
MNQPVGRLGRLADVQKFARLCRGFGCDVKTDMEAGTVEAKDDETVVFAAIRKGGRQEPWILMFGSSDRIAWNHPDRPREPDHEPAL